MTHYHQYEHNYVNQSDYGKRCGSSFKLPSKITDLFDFDHHGKKKSRIIGCRGENLIDFHVDKLRRITWEYESFFILRHR